jgi:hypothetical protein
VLLAFSPAAEAGEPQAEAVRQDIIRPEDVRPGMKGYALTVFEGTEPEPFDIEIVGRLEKMLPQQDIILIRCTDDKLRDMKVVAGMSGSPVYVKDADGKTRLVGALAYSWSFQIEAVAGVTPITNMLGGPEGPERQAAGRLRGSWPGPAHAASSGQRRRPDQAAADPLFALGPAGRDRQMSGRRGPPRERAPGRSRPAPPGPDEAPGGLSPVATPLMVSGLPVRCFAELRRQLAPLGLEPVQGGGGGGTDEGGGAGRGFRPGDAIGVQLMRGDSDWTAIGTVTHVEGSRVLAFGHSFLQAGAWEAPVTRADVQIILKSSMRSMKLANAGPVVGKLVDDRQACIAAELGGRARMVPVEVEVTGAGRGDRAFRYEIVQHPTVSGMLASWALTDSMSAAYPWQDDATITVRQRIEVAGHAPVEVVSVESTSGSFSYSMTRPLAVVLANPFERVKLERLTYRVNVEPRRRTARILSVRAAKPEVKPGTEVTLYVKLRPFGGEDTELPFTLRVPAWPREGRFQVAFRGGDGVSPDIPPPRNLPEYLDAVRALHAYLADELVLTPPGSGRGESFAVHMKDRVRISKKTPWVLSGSVGISLILRE